MMFRVIALWTFIFAAACGSLSDPVNSQHVSSSVVKPKIILAYEVTRKPGENLRVLSKRYQVPLPLLERFNPRDGQTRPRNVIFVPISHGPKQSDLRIVKLTRDEFLRPVKVGDWSAAEEEDFQSLEEWFEPEESQRLSFPVEGYISSGYSWRWNRFHKGIDIAAKVGTPILAAQEGTVSFRGWKKGFGLLVIIDHKFGRTYYAHCQSSKAKVGQKVSRGDLIARVGTTGAAMGSHLHFEYRDYFNKSIDPTPFLIPPCTRPVALSAQPNRSSLGTTSWAAKAGLCQNSDI